MVSLVSGPFHLQRDLAMINETIIFSKSKDFT